MAGLEEKPTTHKATLFVGLLQACALYLVYLAVSLTDLWGYMPAMVQAGIYGLLALTMMTVIARGLMAKSIWTVKAGLKGAFLSVMLLTTAMILAGSDARRLLEIAVKPRAIFTYPIPEIVMTVIPPSYMEQAVFSERFIHEDDPSSSLKPLMEGSEIMIRVKNTAYAPTLIAGHNRVAFLSVEDGGFVAHFTLKDETRWQIREGSHKVGEWPILILADDTPTIERADFRQILSGDGIFGLSLHLRDDYGLQEVAIGVVPTGGDADILFERTILKVSGLKEFSGEVYLNLGSSDFAGSMVDLILEVTDQAGQKQQKILADIMLPEKDFVNPTSRKIIEIRADIKAQPEIRKKLARQLMALGLVPDDGQTPTIYYMALRSAYWRLTSSDNDSEIASARDILWDLAVQLEDGDADHFTQEILAQMASLKLALYQHQDVAIIREQLQDMDKTIVLFLRKQKALSPGQPGFWQNKSGKYDPEKFDVKEMRRIYGKILTHSHFKRFDQAIDLTSYLEHGFIYSDRGILSGQSYERFQIVSRARDRVNILKKTQQKVMSFAYKNTVKLELASLYIKNTDNLTKSFNSDIHKWIAIQQKLGVSVNELGRTLAKSGIDAADLTVAASDLIRDVVHSLETGNMEAAVGFQGEVLTVFNRLKNILEMEMHYSPESL